MQKWNQEKTQQTQQNQTPETCLWKGVFTQALSDATYDGSRLDYLHWKRRAIVWLTSYSKDFQMVMMYAEYEPAYMLGKLTKANKEGYFIMTEKQNNILCKIVEYKSKVKYKPRFKLKF